MRKEKLNELKIKLEEKIKYYNHNYEKYDDEVYNRNYLAYTSLVGVLNIDQQIEFLLYFIKNDGIETKWNYIYLEKAILESELKLEKKVKTLADLCELYQFQKNNRTKENLLELIKSVQYSISQTIDSFKNI